MKHIFNILSCAAFLAVSSFAVSSCKIFDDDKEYQLSSATFVTISKIDGKNVFFMDKGGVLLPTQESVDAITEKKGFGDKKRAYVYFNYYEKELSYSETKKEYTIYNADLTFGRYLDMGNIKTRAQATEENQFAADSLTKLDLFQQLWVYRGYLNITGKGSYVSTKDGAIKPTLTLVYEPSEISENSIKFAALYNRHAPKDAATISEYDLLDSFDITSFASMIPGTDSVTVSVEAEGLQTLKYKFGRKDFTYRESIED